MNTMIPTDGAVIVRLRATGSAGTSRTGASRAGAASWTRNLPRVPGGRILTVTVGSPDLLPVSTAELLRRGYRLVGVAAAHRPIGPTVDVLVPLELRDLHPKWWGRLAPHVDRVFDLRLGPVRKVLEAEIELHLRHAEA